MQDRFKFRCFYSDDKKMYYHDFELPKIAKEDEKFATIMQCTGLKDKNGKLIYEGDIVKVWKFSTGELSKRVVVWNEARAGFRLYKIDEFKRNIHNSPQSMLNVTTMEIIGNIYESPELLKVN